jgi:hypothetical protein
MMDGLTERFRVFLRILRVLRPIAVWGALTLFTLLLAALAINAFDQRPSPETLALIQPPENRYRPEENLCVALARFDALPGQSVVAVGQAKIARYNARVNSMLRDPLLGLKRLLRPIRWD